MLRGEAGEGGECGAEGSGVVWIMYFWRLYSVECLSVSAIWSIFDMGSA